MCITICIVILCGGVYCVETPRLVTYKLFSLVIKCQ